MCEPLCTHSRQAPMAAAAVVTGSTISAAALATTGTPTLDALLLIAGAGAAGAVSVRLSAGRPVRTLIRSLLGSSG